MSFLELARKRYAARSFKPVPIERDKLMQVLEAGRIAPSAVNRQPRYFIVVQDKELKDKIVSTYAKEWIREAPVIIVVCGDHSTSWNRADGKDYCDVDVAIAIDHMTLAAAELGLGTCWVCSFDTKKCHSYLSLPEHLEVVALLPIGYPTDEADITRHESKRKKIDEIVYWDGFNK